MIDQTWFYTRLPTILRERDHDNGYPLRALLRVIAKQADRLQGDMGQLYEDHFIETCQPWVIPYLGDLVSNELIWDSLRPAGTDTAGDLFRDLNGSPAADGSGNRSGLVAPLAARSRADVANTIRFRRRKGTYSVLAPLCQAVTGWFSHVVDTRRVLGATQNLDHPSTGVGWLNLRRPDLSDVLDGPFDSASHTVRLRTPSGQVRYGPGQIAVYLWRLQSDPLTLVAARPADTYWRRSFSPLRNHAPLFRKGRLDAAGNGPVTELDAPGPIRPAELKAHLARLYGASLTVYVNHSPVPGSNVRVDSLNPWPTQRPPNNLVRIDPNSGRLAIGRAFGPDSTVEVSWHAGFSGNLGGGPYDRQPWMIKSVALPLKVSQDPAVSGAFADLAQALVAWTAQGRPDAVISILDSRTYNLPDRLLLPRAGSLAIEAANGQRPVLLSGLEGFRVEVDPTPLDAETEAALTLNGVALEGHVQVAGSLRRLRLLHSTLVPGRRFNENGRNLVAGPSLVVLGGEGGPARNRRLRVEIAYSITGALRIPEDAEGLWLLDSIVDGLGGAAIAGIERRDRDAAPATMQRATVLGPTFARELNATEVIFTGPVFVDRIQPGCLRYCHVPVGSRTPRRFACQPDLAIEGKTEQALRANPQLGPVRRAELGNLAAAEAFPRFTSVQYGVPGYCQLGLDCPAEIRTGAEDGSELGAFSFLKQPQRVSNLNVRLADYLPIGLDPTVVYVTQECEMGGDYTRLTFDAKKRFAGVRMQQGRVQLDSDWNELVDILDRRARAQSLDTFGPSAVPVATPHGFYVRLENGALTLGTGRMYVDGLLVENQGDLSDPAAARVDPRLGDLQASAPVDYANQPFFPDAAQSAPLPQTGIGIAYVEAWHREVTAVEDPDIVEPAVGVDTTTRIQTAWQVRFIALPEEYLRPGHVENSPEWQALVSPSSGRLSTETIGLLDGDPSGFTGGENRLYRVEVHDPGLAGSATFKWSSANASAVSPVVAISADRRHVAISRTRSDPVLAVRAGDWVEIVDDWDELSHRPGAMAAVVYVDQTTGMVTLNAPLPERRFDATAVERHTRMRRWDQKGFVFDANGKLYADVALRGGVIPIPADSSVKLLLESGIAVSFSGGSQHPPHRARPRPRVAEVIEEEVVETPAGDVEVIVESSESEGEATDDATPPSNQSSSGMDFHAADYWTFAARTDGSLETLRDVPPRGIGRHYAPLAILDFPDNALNLPVIWPPQQVGEGGAGCGCAACVTSASHESETLTLQRAVDQVKGTGGTVCLGPGVYVLEDFLDLAGAESLTLSGSGWATVLVYTGSGAAVRVADALGVTLEDLTIVAAAPPGDHAREAQRLFPGGLTGPAARIWASIERVARRFTGSDVSCVVIRDSVGVSLRRCLAIQLADPAAGSPVIGLEGLVVGTTMRENTIIGASGLANRSMIGVDRGEYVIAAAREAQHDPTKRLPYLVAVDLEVKNNQIWCSRSGVSLRGLTLHVGDSRISGNYVFGGTDGAMVFDGATAVGRQGSDHRLTIEGNTVRADGRGIVVGTDNARVHENDVRPATRPQFGERESVEEPNRAAMPITDRESGIVVTVGLKLERVDGCEIRGNHVEGMTGHGVLVSQPVGSLLVEANKIARIGGFGFTMGDAACGKEVLLRANRLHDVILIPHDGLLPVSAVLVHDVEHVEVTDNLIHGIGQTRGGNAGRSGIQLLQCTTVRVRGNDLRRFGQSQFPLGLSAGIDIAITNVSSEIEVVDNIVRLETTPVGSLWLALRIQSLSGEPTPQTTFEGLRRLSRFFSRGPHPVHGQTLASTAGDEDGVDLTFGYITSVRGNLLEASGPAMTAEINIAGPCTFSDNQCLRTTSTDGNAIVQISAHAVIFNANYVLGAGTTSAVVTTSGGNPAWTVLGNICENHLVVNDLTNNEVPTGANLNFYQ